MSKSENPEPEGLVEISLVIQELEGPALAGRLQLPTHDFERLQVLQKKGITLRMTQLTQAESGKTTVCVLQMVGFSQGKLPETENPLMNDHSV